jgi:hypothetical protein
VIIFAHNFWSAFDVWFGCDVCDILFSFLLGTQATTSSMCIQILCYVVGPLPSAVLLLGVPC